ncbi:MAG: ketopantoate reductase family protein [Rubrivivax sp.]
MQVAVMGAGAVGCFYGARLALAGHPVSLIGRAAHMDVVQRQGLRFDSGGRTRQVPMTATTDPAAARGADLVLLCVKATDTEAAAAALQPHLAPGTPVLSLQNGIDNVARLLALPGWSDLRPEAAVVYAAVEMAAPGHLLHRGRGDLVVGAAPGARHWIGDLRAASVPVQEVLSIDSALWAKLVVNCAYNALSAIARLPYGTLMQHAPAAALVAAVVAECRAVAAAAGVALPEDLQQMVQRIPDSMPQQSSSTAQDLRRGRRSEIDHLNGAIARIGAEYGVAVPVNRTLHALVRLLEDAAAA